MRRAFALGASLVGALAAGAGAIAGAAHASANAGHDELDSLFRDTRKRRATVKHGKHGQRWQGAKLRGNRLTTSKRVRRKHRRAGK